MLRKTISLIFLIVLITSSLAQVSQSQVSKNQIKVLFDFTKDEDAGNADWTVDGAYSEWAKALRERGIEVDSFGDGHGTITYDLLKNYSVFVIPEPQDPFTTDEKNAILEFVSNGGGLVYIADHKGSDRNNNGWDSWKIWNYNLNFDSIFGINLESTESGSNEHVVTDIENVPILTDNVSSFGLWDGATMNVSSGAYAAAYQNINGVRYPVLSYTFYGNGRVVIHCDSSTFDDGTPDSNNTHDHLYDVWSEYDDAQLGINLILWASQHQVPEISPNFVFVVFSVSLPIIIMERKLNKTHRLSHKYE